MENELNLINNEFTSQIEKDHNKKITTQCHIKKHSRYNFFEVSFKNDTKIYCVEIYNDGYILYPKLTIKEIYKCKTNKKLLEDFRESYKALKYKNNEKKVIELINDYLCFIWFDNSLKTVSKNYKEIIKIIKECDTLHNDLALSLLDIGINIKPFVNDNKEDKEELEDKINNLEDIKNEINSLKNLFDNFDFDLSSMETKKVRQGFNYLEEVQKDLLNEFEEEKEEIDDKEDVTIYDLYNITSTDELLKQFEDDYKALKKKSDVIPLICKLNAYLWFNRSLNTTKSYYTDLIKIVKNNKKRFNAHTLTFLQMGKTVSLAIRSQKDFKGIEKKSLKKTKIDLEYYDNKIIELKEMILGYETMTMPKLKQQKYPRLIGYYTAIYLALVTGRRGTEIFKTLSIANKKEKIYYQGLIKTKDSKITEIEAVYLDDINTIEFHLNKLRTSDAFKVKGLTNKQVNNRFSNLCNSYVREFFNDIPTFHDLRAIYAELCYQKFNNDELEREDYYRQIFGHMEVKATPTAHYIKFDGKK